MSSKSNKPALAAGIAGTLFLTGATFAATPLAQGYMLGAQDAAPAADKAAHEGKCGEGKCGMDKMDTDKDGRISRAEFSAAHGGKDDKFGAHDPNNDGFISAEEMKAHHDAKRGEKAAMEGKCGEGKCGAM